jgi:hypothetical protein
MGFYKGASLAFAADKIKKLYLEGKALKDINKALKFTDDKTTTIDNIIEAMQNPNSGTPLTITKSELATRPNIIGTNQLGLSKQDRILNDPKLRSEFIEYANSPGVTLRDIRKKYKVSTLHGSGQQKDAGKEVLRDLVTKDVQLGRQGVDPNVTERLQEVKEAIENANLPKTELTADSKAIKDLANNLNIDVKKLLSDVVAIKTGRIGDINKRLFNRFPDPGFTQSLLKQQGYSKRTQDTLTSVENAAYKISQSGTNLEHSMAKSFIKQNKLPRKYILTGERTTNFLNQFKTQHDKTLLDAAKKYAESGQTSKDYKEYKKIVNETRKLVADKTGGYKIGYVDFVDGKAIAKTDNVSILKGEGELGKNATGLSKFIKNSLHHNKLYDAHKANPKDPAFGTLRKEIAKKKYKFVREDELENSYNATKNFKTKEEYINYYNKNPDDLFFQGLATAAGVKGGAGKAIIGGSATAALLATSLAAEELNSAKQAGSLLPEAAGAAAVGGTYAARKPIIKGLKTAGKVALKTLAPLAVPLEAGFIVSDLKSGASTPEALANVAMLGGAVRQKEKMNYITKKYGEDVYQELQRQKGNRDAFDIGLDETGEISEYYKQIDLEGDQAVQDLKTVRAEEFERQSNLPRPEIEDYGIDIGEDYGIDIGDVIEEYNNGGRVGYADGPKDPKRRTVIKGLTALAALPVIGKYFKLVKSPKAAAAVETVMEKVSGMPDWFQPFVNKVLKMGDDVTDSAATAEREIVKRIDIEDATVDVHYNTATNDVKVEVFGGNKTALDQPLELNYKAPEVIEETGKKTKGEFKAVESRPEAVQTGPDDYDFEAGENVTDVLDDLLSETDYLEGFATGKIRTPAEIKRAKNKAFHRRNMKEDPAQYILEEDMANFSNPDAKAYETITNLDEIENLLTITKTKK